MSRVRPLYPVAFVLASWLAGCTSVPESRPAAAASADPRDGLPAVLYSAGRTDESPRDP